MDKKYKIEIVDRMKGNQVIQYIGGDFDSIKDAEEFAILVCNTDYPDFLMIVYKIIVIIPNVVQ